MSTCDMRVRENTRMPLTLIRATLGSAVGDRDARGTDGASVGELARCANVASAGRAIDTREVPSQAGSQ